MWYFNGKIMNPESIPPIRGDNEIKRLPRYKFNRGAELSEEEKEAITSFLKEREITVPEGSKETQEELREEFGKMIANAYEWTEQVLGLDVRDREPVPEKIVVMKPEEYKKMLGELWDASTGGHYHGMSEAIFVLERGLARTTGNFNHELVHRLSQATRKIERDENEQINIGMHSVGFANEKTESLLFVNEWMTEMINMEMLSYHDSNSKDKKILPDYNLGYHEGIFFFDLVLNEAAGRLGIENKNLRHDLYKAYFEGNTAALGVIDNAFGKGSLSNLALIKKQDYNFAPLRALAVKFGVVSQYNEKLKTYGKGTEVTILDGIPTKAHFHRPI